MRASLIATRGPQCRGYSLIQDEACRPNVMYRRIFSRTTRRSSLQLVDACGPSLLNRYRIRTIRICAGDDLCARYVAGEGNRSSG